MSHQKLVREFHEKFGIPVRDKPGVPSDERVRLRMRLKFEECFEFAEDCFHQDFADAECLRQIKLMVLGLVETARIKVNLSGAIKEIADCLYVDLGTAVEFGCDIGPIFEAVDASNKTKDGAPDAGGKVTKGPSYVPPDVIGLLKAQGWEP